MTTTEKKAIVDNILELLIQLPRYLYWRNKPFIIERDFLKSLSAIEVDFKSILKDID